MKIVAHADPVVLERELVARVTAAHPVKGVPRTLVVVPNKRLGRHVERRLAAERPGWLGVEVLHFGALAQRILREARVRPPRALSSLLLDAVAQRVLLRLEGNHWARFVGSRPGALGRIRASLNDLREAWIDPKQAGSEARSSSERALVAIYAGYWKALEDGAAGGWGDAASVAHTALRHTGKFARGCGSIFLHGAYELIGIHLDLVQALDKAKGVTALVPMHAGAPASVYAQRFAETFLSGDAVAVEATASDRPDLSALYDEATRPAPAADLQFSFRHAQGEAAEVRTAVREALEAVRTGCPPEEIVIAARSLEPYAAALEEEFDDAGVPWTSSLSAPLRRQPRVRDFLLLLQAVSNDFPRRPTAQLLRSHRLRWGSVAEQLTRSDLSPADVWSRRARLLGGLGEWTEVLPRWASIPQLRPGQSEEERLLAHARAEERSIKAGAIARAVRGLNEAVAPAKRKWGEHASRLTELLHKLFLPPEDGPQTAAISRLEGLLDEMADLETVGETATVEFPRVVRWLEDAVDASSPPLHETDDGGVRVVDLMQLRGATCRRLHLLGVNSGLLPQPPRDDPILGDGFRARLVDATARPLPIQHAGVEEERLLLALTVGSATERVDASWQRADESGRAKTPSLALRELARLARGRPEVESLEPTHVPSHPAQALEHLLVNPGMLSPEEGVLLTALQGRGADAVAALAKRHPYLAPGIAMLDATQGFRIVDPAYDGRIGPSTERAAASVSVSALESLGRCPLQFFFKHVLGVRELDEPASALDVSPRDAGLQIHDLLERVYRALIDEGRLDSGAQARNRAHELLSAERAGILGDLGARWAERLPVLGEHIARHWYDAVVAFVDADLGWLAEHDAAPRELESPRTVDCDFGGVSVRVSARFDRTVSRKDGSCLIGDYKTSGNLDKRTNVADMLKGRALQVPLYALLAGEAAEVELLGVGPGFGTEETGDYRFPFPGFGDEQRRGFTETMRVLLTLRERGIFPLRSDTHCNWCAYSAACRQNHAPTVDREAIANDGAEYRRVGKKTSRSPLLAGPTT